MKANIEPLVPERYYHIYNRGINGEIIFKKDSHYKIFLDKFAFHVVPFIDIFAYCLMSNHFHFLIRIKSEEVIKPEIALKYPGKKIESFEKFLSSQFAHLFNGYTQIVNKDNRTGGLFESPFRRKEVKSEAYFSNLITYIHQDPQIHGFVDDFKDYSYSSYWSHLLKRQTKLKRDEVINW